MFCIESCVVRTLGDQDFANTVAYRSHSDMDSKSIRSLRFGGPTFHDELHMSNPMSAGPPWGSTWRLETISTSEERCTGWVDVRVPQLVVPKPSGLMSFKLNSFSLLLYLHILL